MAFYQDPLDPSLDLAGVPPTPAKVKVSGGYLVQVKVANPPMCTLCIREMQEGQRKRATPNRVTHRGWLPGWKSPCLMCPEHAVDFGTANNLFRA